MGDLFGAESGPGRADENDQNDGLYFCALDSSPDFLPLDNTSLRSGPAYLPTPPSLSTYGAVEPDAPSAPLLTAAQGRELAPFAALEQTLPSHTFGPVGLHIADQSATTCTPAPAVCSSHGMEPPAAPPESWGHEAKTTRAVPNDYYNKKQGPVRRKPPKKLLDFCAQGMALSRGSEETERVARNIMQYYSDHGCQSDGPKGAKARAYEARCPKYNQGCHKRLRFTINEQKQPFCFVTAEHDPTAHREEKQPHTFSSTPTADDSAHSNRLHIPESRRPMPKHEPPRKKQAVGSNASPVSCFTESHVAPAASSKMNVRVEVVFPAERRSEIMDLIHEHANDLKKSNMRVVLLPGEDICLLSVSGREVPCGDQAELRVQIFLGEVSWCLDDDKERQKWDKEFAGFGYQVLNMKPAHSWFLFLALPAPAVQILRAAWPRMLAKSPPPADLPLKTDRMQPRFCEEEGLLAQQWLFADVPAPWLPGQSKLYRACQVAQRLFPWAGLAAQAGCVLRVAVGPLQLPGYVFQHFLQQPDYVFQQEMGPVVQVEHGGRVCIWQQAPLQACSLRDQIRAEFGLPQNNTLRLVRSTDGQAVSLESLLSGTYKLTVEPLLANQQTRKAPFFSVANLFDTIKSSMGGMDVNLFWLLACFMLFLAWAMRTVSVVEALESLTLPLQLIIAFYIERRCWQILPAGVLRSRKWFSLSRYLLCLLLVCVGIISPALFMTYDSLPRDLVARQDGHVLWDAGAGLGAFCPKGRIFLCLAVLGVARLGPVLAVAPLLLWLELWRLGRAWGARWQPRLVPALCLASRASLLTHLLWTGASHLPYPFSQLWFMYVMAMLCFWLLAAFFMSHAPSKTSFLGYVYLVWLVTYCGLCLSGLPLLAASLHLSRERAAATFRLTGWCIPLLCAGLWLLDQALWHCGAPPLLFAGDTPEQTDPKETSELFEKSARCNAADELLTEAVMKALKSAVKGQSWPEPVQNELGADRNTPTGELSSASAAAGLRRRERAELEETRVEDQMQRTQFKAKQKETMAAGGLGADVPAGASLDKPLERKDFLAGVMLDERLERFPCLDPRSVQLLRKRGLDRAGQLVAPWFGDCGFDPQRYLNWLEEVGVNKSAAAQIAQLVGAKYPRAHGPAVIKARNKTSISDWVQSDGLLEELSQFPTVGEVTQSALAKQGITRAGQLVEQWFGNCQMDERLFAAWLKDKGVRLYKQCSNAVSLKYPKVNN